MIAKEQISTLSKKLKISETVIFREYLQLFFLSKLYSISGSEKIFFKGGTAIHLIFGAPRFSEDLDFSVNIEIPEFTILIDKLFDRLSKEEEVSFKERKTIAGKRYLMTGTMDSLSYNGFINLDFSFREKIFTLQKSIIKIDYYPILFTSYIFHPSKEEIFAEKIRALLTRKKGRDFYDLWFLLSQNTVIDKNLINEKLKYYKLSTLDLDIDLIKKRLEEFTEKEFILDIRPFIPIDERKRLPELYNYIKDFLKSSF